jgi:hypothetical protein
LKLSRSVENSPHLPVVPSHQHHALAQPAVG